MLHARSESESSSSSSGFERARWGAPTPPLERGAAILPGYEVVGHLRRGRHLDVYDVWSDERQCRCVAKTVRPERAADHATAERLRREGELLARLSHPHLVRAYETGDTTEARRPVVVLETLTGQTVSYLVDERGAFSPEDVAVLGVQLCSVVGYLHAMGWLHADIKPSNIVASGGRAVLLDLSIACRVGDRDVGGTFDYLSPEQARDEPATEAIDVWGIGATLFETIVAAPPFDAWPHARGADGRRVYPQPIIAAPRLEGRQRLPSALAAAVDSCLRPDPADRPSVPELSAALADAIGLDPRQYGAAAGSIERRRRQPGPQREVGGPSPASSSRSRRSASSPSTWRRT